MKKYIQLISIFILIIIFLLGLLYIGLAVYYRNGFSYGTFINGIYCTGKSVEEVNKELNEGFHVHNLNVQLRDGEKQIDLKSIDYSYDFSNPLNIYLNNQNSFLWIENLFIKDSGITLYPQGIYDKDKFEKEFNTLGLFKNDDGETVKLILDDNGYVLKDPKENVLIIDKTKSTIEDALIKGHLDVNLEQAACYEDMAYSDSELYLKEIYPYLDEFQNKDIVYKFGDDERRLSKKELACLIKCDENKIPVLDDNASLIIDKDAVKNLIQNIGDEFNTYCNHYFTTHNGDSVYIDTGNYGNEINAKTEIEWLYEFLTKEDNVIIHEPEYLHTANYLGKNDIGDTYIEVSISEQKMFYFKDGEMILSTDVVTGNAGRKRDTPQKVCFVYGKQEKRVLRGPGYASFVNFWMPVSGNIGIHDSPWRSEYGGEIYKTNGSHGCINTPYDVMKELYEAVEIGTPAIIYDTNNTN